MLVQNDFASISMQGWNSETLFMHENAPDTAGYNSYHVCRNRVGMRAESQSMYNIIYKSVLLNDIIFMSKVIEIFSVKVTIGN